MHLTPLEGWEMGLFVGYGFMALAFWGLFLAHRDGQLDVKCDHRPTHAGPYPRPLNFYYASDHKAATHGDTFIFPLASWFMVLSHKQWSPTEISICLAVGMLVSVIYHLGKPKRVQVPGHLYDPDLSFRRAAMVHVLYMAFAFTVLGLYLFCTSSYSRWASTSVVILMAIFLVLSMWKSDAGHHFDKKTKPFAKVGTVLGIVLMFAHWVFWVQ